MKKTLPEIVIENGALKRIPQKIKALGNSFTIITDANLKPPAENLRINIQKAGMRCNLLIIPPGEKTKSLDYVERISRSLVKLNVKRDGVLLAFGGGVIGDLVGFIASIYMRGIKFISVPTTLLAMGDSSIGAKTGIDLDEGKNLLGTFYYPSLVIMDPAVLKNLPEKELKAGLSEVIKHSIIADKKFFNFLEKNSQKILKKHMPTLKQLIEKSVKIKLSIVKGDERESIEGAKAKSRMLLNYGHTVGHALEKLSDFTLGHGNAVSIGMVAENRLAVGKNLLKKEDAARITSILKKFGLPTTIPDRFSSAAIQKAMQLDKKNFGNKLNFALPTKIGHAKVFPL